MYTSFLHTRNWKWYRKCVNYTLPIHHVYNVDLMPIRYKTSASYFEAYMYGDCISVMYSKKLFQVFIHNSLQWRYEVVNNSKYYDQCDRNISPECTSLSILSCSHGCRPWQNFVLHTLIGSCVASSTFVLMVLTSGSGYTCRENGDFITLPPGDLFHCFPAPMSNNFANNCTPSWGLYWPKLMARVCGLSKRSFLGRVR